MSVAEEVLAAGAKLAESLSPRQWVDRATSLIIDRRHADPERQQAMTRELAALWVAMRSDKRFDGNDYAWGSVDGARDVLHVVLLGDDLQLMNALARHVDGEVAA